MNKDELKRTSNEAPLSEVIDKLLRAYRLDGKMKELDIIDAWPEMMGTAVSHCPKESFFKKKKLYPTMDSPLKRDVFYF